jgi:hypothetical protein
MEHLARSLKMVWQSERLLRENEIRLTLQKAQLSALAGLVGIFGLVMVSLAVFFLLVPHLGHSLAALGVGGIDLVLAILLMVWARGLKPAPELGLVKEVRDMALADVEEELALAEAEVIALKDDVRAFIRSPLDSLLPGTIGPLLGAVGRGIASPKKK